MKRNHNALRSSHPHKSQDASVPLRFLHLGLSMWDASQLAVIDTTGARNSYAALASLGTTVSATRLAQGTKAQQPSQVGGQNGRTVARFNSANLQTFSLPSNNGLIQNISYQCCLSAFQTATVAPLLAFTTNGSTTLMRSQFAASFTGSNGMSNTGRRLDADAAFTVGSGASAKSSAWQVGRWTTENLLTYQGCFQNGSLVLQSSSFSTAGLTSNTTSDIATVGRTIAASPIYGSFDLGATLFFCGTARPSTEEIAVCERWLGRRFGVFFKRLKLFYTEFFTGYDFYQC